MRIGSPADAYPRPIFTTLNAVAVIVGIVVGIGIFRLPPLVAANAGSGFEFMVFWLAGGVISLAGALCYAELSASHPDAGGEYHFLTRAFGSTVGFLFSWGRMTVIQTGSITLAAFVLGDYARLLLDLGAYSSSIYAAFTVILLTAINIMGTRPSKITQNIVTGAIVTILLVAGIYALTADPSVPAITTSGASGAGGGAIGAAMIFVLLTYGGWNEAAYLSAEVFNVKKSMSRILVFSIGLITLIYLLINYAYLNILGLEGIRNAQTVGADLSNQLFGEAGGIALSIMVIIAAVSTSNATIITGARTNYALGRDFTFLRFLGSWDRKHDSPRPALLVQGVISLLLVGLGAITKQGVSTMVDYTAPVFWFFLLLTGITLFLFRYREPDRERPFRVPVYPATPLVFIGASSYMLYSSISFTGIGALIGVGILLTGLPVYWWGSRRYDRLD